MRVTVPAITAAVLLTYACRGSEPPRTGSARAVDSSTAVPSTVAPATGSASATAAPITGTIHEVRMVGDAEGYRFEPAHIAAKVGDGVKFVVVSMPPHNIAFDPATIPPGSKDQLFANMPGGTDGSSPMLILEDDSWTLSLGGLPPGRYPFHCTPHLAMGMKGDITITP